MKQLSSTGWVHNRLRIVASSFMVKNLLLPWQWGLKHFWDAQLDAGNVQEEVFQGSVKHVGSLFFLSESVILLFEFRLFI